MSATGTFVGGNTKPFSAALSAAVEIPASMIGGQPGTYQSSAWIIPNDFEKAKLQYWAQHPVLMQRWQTFLETMNGITDWQQAHREALAYLESVRGTTLDFYHEQLVACAMLRVFFLDKSITKNMQPAIERYLTMLIQRRNSYETLVMAKALLLLQGYISDSVLQAMAKRILENARAADAERGVNQFSAEQFCTAVAERHRKAVSAEHQHQSVQEIASMMREQYRGYIKRVAGYLGTHTSTHTALQLPAPPADGMVYAGFERGQGLLLLTLMTETQPQVQR